MSNQWPPLPVETSAGPASTSQTRLFFAAGIVGIIVLASIALPTGLVRITADTAATAATDATGTDSAPTAVQGSAEPTPAPLPSNVLRPDGLGPFSFGASRSEVMTWVRATLGEPELQRTHTSCVDLITRAEVADLELVIWGSTESSLLSTRLQFSDSKLVGWMYGGQPETWTTTEWTTTEGFGIGDAQSELDRLYPGGSIEERYSYLPGPEPRVQTSDSAWTGTNGMHAYILDGKVNRLLSRSVTCSS